MQKLKRRHEGFYVHTRITIDQLSQLLRNVLRWNRFATLPSHFQPDSTLLQFPTRSSMRRRRERAGVHRATGFTFARMGILHMEANKLPREEISNCFIGKSSKVDFKRFIPSNSGLSLAAKHTLKWVSMWRRRKSRAFYSQKTQHPPTRKGTAGTSVSD